MTLTGLKAAKKEFDLLKALLPRSPTGHDKLLEAWLSSLTPEEISRAASILVRVDRGAQPSPEEIEFMNTLAERPFEPPAPLARGQPRCRVCGKQPATKDGAWSFCKRCHDAMSGGNVHIG